MSIGPLLQCVTGVLQEAFLRKHFGFTFVQILRFQILTNHNYCIRIGQDVWKGIFIVVFVTLVNLKMKKE